MKLSSREMIASTSRGERVKSERDKEKVERARRKMETQQWAILSKKPEKKSAVRQCHFCPARIFARPSRDWPLTEYKRLLCDDPLKIVVRLIGRRLIR